MAVNHYTSRLVTFGSMGELPSQRNDQGVKMFTDSFWKSSASNWLKVCIYFINSYKFYIWNLNRSHNRDSHMISSLKKKKNQISGRKIYQIRIIINLKIFVMANIETSILIKRVTIIIGSRLYLKVSGLVWNIWQHIMEILQCISLKMVSPILEHSTMTIESIIIENI